MLKAKSQNYILVGIFILIALSVLILFFVLKSGGWDKKVKYLVELDNVAGLQLGASVLYEGYTIGEVTSIDPKPKMNQMMFDVILNIRADWRIPEDSVAIIDTVNLLSKESIIIKSGISKNILKADSYITSGKKTDIFATANELAQKINKVAEEELIPLISENIQLLNQTTKDISSKINDTADNIYEVTVQLKDLLSDDKYVSRMNNFTKNMEDTSVIVKDLTKNLETMSEKTSSDIMISTSRIDDFTKNMIEISQVAKDFSQNLEEISENSSSDILSSTSDLSFILNTISNSIVELNESLDQTIRNFEAFSRQIKNNPSVIIRGTENE